MQQHNITQIISADRHFDSVPDITRLDPASWIV
jgi:predicted nucleic acid-binding protein